MRSVLALAAVAAAFGFPAHAATDCGRVKAFKDMNLLEIDGVSYRMRSERIGKKSWRLIGHDMYFVHTPGSRSTYDSYFSGDSLRSRSKSKSGCAAYCVEWLRRTWSSTRPLVGRR